MKGGYVGDYIIGKYYRGLIKWGETIAHMPDGLLLYPGPRAHKRALAIKGALRLSSSHVRRAGW